jgi:hypothetical protein
MNKRKPVGTPAPDGGWVEDLELRLTRLRSRMLAEGRLAAVIQLDKAIARASKRRSSTANGE